MPLGGLQFQAHLFSDSTQEAKKEVQAFSPTLAGRKAMTTATMTPADIADELVSLLAEEKGKVSK